MSLSNALDPVPVEDAGPVVEIVETSYDEVSPAPSRFSRLRRSGVLTLKVVAVLTALLAYPVLVVASHNIDDRPVELDMSVWSAREVGTATALLRRELDGPGWATDRANWRPQARLVALPAWQETLTATLSQWLGTRAGEGDAADPDLSSAARLLMPDPSTATKPQLVAGLEALARFDGRVDSNLATLAEGLPVLVSDLRLFADMAALSLTDLSIQIAEQSDWPASRVDIRTYYMAKARAQVAANLLTAAGQARQGDLLAVDRVEEWTKAVDLWTRAASQKPLFVSNQNGDTMFSANHLAVMAFYLGEAEAVARALADDLETAKVLPRAPTDLAVVATSP